MGKRIKEDCYIKVIRTIEKYKLISTGDKLVVCVSGGPDSMCLLDILLKIQKKSCQNGTSPLATFEIVVAHVNHMIREEAKEDEEYVKNYCIKNDIQFYSKSIEVEKIANTKKIGTEEAGRIARYKFFDEIMKKTCSNKIVIAHNKNDNAETMIMNILRGTGTTGLKGIEPIRDKYIRPLIECERKEIEEYCEENDINPRIDKTNFENTYTRNKIRNIVIPYIEKEFNPNIIETMNRLSNLVAGQEDYIQKQVEIAYKKILLEEKMELDQMEKNVSVEQTDKKDKEEKAYILLDLKGFNAQEKVIKSKIILYTITRLFGSTKGIEKVHIEDMITLCANNVGNKYLTPNKNLKIFVKNGKIKISKEV